MKIIFYTDLVWMDRSSRQHNDIFQNNLPIPTTISIFHLLNLIKLPASRLYDLFVSFIDFGNEFQSVNFVCFE